MDIAGGFGGFQARRWQRVVDSAAAAGFLGYYEEGE